MLCDYLNEKDTEKALAANERIHYLKRIIKPFYDSLKKESGYTVLMPDGCKKINARMDELYKLSYDSEIKKWNLENKSNSHK